MTGAPLVGSSDQPTPTTGALFAARSDFGPGMQAHDPRHAALTRRGALEQVAAERAAAAERLGVSDEAHASRRAEVRRELDRARNEGSTSA